MHIPYTALILKLLIIVPDVLGFTCSENSTLCVECMKLGEKDLINTFYTSGQCSVFTAYKGETTDYSEAEICELLFLDSYPTSCQMAVISDVDLLGYYIQYGIRAAGHSMLLSLYRENCSDTWNWWSRLENDTTSAGIGDANEDCDIVQGAFVDFTLVRLDPFNFTPSGVLCQCGEKVPFLPTVLPKDSPPLRIVLFSFFIFFLVVSSN